MAMDSFEEQEAEEVRKLHRKKERPNMDLVRGRLSTAESIKDNVILLCVFQGKMLTLVSTLLLATRR